jgi:multidrug resistance efflux pump
VVAALAVAAFLYVATAPYQVTADAAVEALVQRTVSAPFDGFIDAAPARAGDLVAEGALLARLDQRDLVLERLRIVTDQRRSRIEYERAIADRDRAAARIRQAEIDQADALLALTDAQIARAELRAPFDGVVVSGDLSQSIGAAVARGEPLFTVAPTDRYRVVLRVDEAGIADIETGQTGALVVAALPDQSFPISIEKITPVAVYAEGRTTFEVEASLAETTARLRPGMEGAARIDVDTRRRIAIWTAPIIDWLRLWRWRWLGW